MLVGDGSEADSHGRRRCASLERPSPSVRLTDQTVEVPEGCAVMAPRGTPHTYWNAGSGPARYVLVMTPEILRLVELLHTLPSRDPETLEAHFREHGSELLELPE